MKICLEAIIRYPVTLNLIIPLSRCKAHTHTVFWKGKGGKTWW